MGKKVYNFRRVICNLIISYFLLNQNIHIYLILIQIFFFDKNIDSDLIMKLVLLNLNQRFMIIRQKQGNEEGGWEGKEVNTGSVDFRTEKDG